MTATDEKQPFVERRGDVRSWPEADIDA